MNLDSLAPPIDFRTLAPEQMALCLQLAQRAKSLALQLRQRFAHDSLIEANPEILAIDFAVLCVRRSYDLARLARADNLVFLSEFAALQMHVNRTCHFFPAHVPLRFAQTGATLKPH